MYKRQPLDIFESTQIRTPSENAVYIHKEAFTGYSDNGRQIDKAGGERYSQIDAETGAEPKVKYV